MSDDRTRPLCDGCWACLRLLNIPATRMILCPHCGNKRCPKASDHLLSCTGSNEAGQFGSIFTPSPEDSAEDRT